MDKQTLRGRVAHLAKHGYFSVDALNISAFQQVIQGYLVYAKDYFGQSMEQKMLHRYSDADGYGYEYRGPEDPNEYKESFHLGLAYEAREGASDEDLRLIAFGKVLMENLRPIVELVAEVISEHSNKNLVDFLVSSLSSATLRILYYPPDLPGMKRDFLATEHTDKGFTIHLGETSPGLQVHWNDTWIDVTERLGSVYGYAGMLGQYYTECGLTALRHRVVPTDLSRMHGRYALVLFLDPGEYRYDKAVWGKTQVAFGKGENYGMPFSEFMKYFALKTVAKAM